MRTEIEYHGLQRWVLVGGMAWAICNITHNDNIEHWSCFDGEGVAEVLRRNGREVITIKDGEVDVDTNIFHFKGETYQLNQCDEIFDWFAKSKEGDFTYYSDRIVFHTHGRKFIAAYRDDIDNFMEV